MIDRDRVMIVLGLCVLCVAGMVVLPSVVPPPVSVLLLAALVLAASYAAYRVEHSPELEEQRRAKGLCTRCGYDLTGNLSGVCPECGRPR